MEKGTCSCGNEASGIFKFGKSSRFMCDKCRDELAEWLLEGTDTGDF